MNETEKLLAILQKSFKREKFLRLRQHYIAYISGIKEDNVQRILNELVLNNYILYTEQDDYILLFPTDKLRDWECNL